MREELDPSSRRAVVAERPALLRLALLLTGDRGSAEELVQRALAAVLHRRLPAGELDLAGRREVVRGLTGRRARSLPRQQVIASVGAAVVTVDEPAVVAALRALPPRTRAAAVLRCYEQWPVEEVARIVGAPVAAAAAEADDGVAQLAAALGTEDGDRVREALADVAEAPGRWLRDGDEAVDDATDRPRRARRRWAGTAAAGVAAAAVAALLVAHSLPPTGPPAGGSGVQAAGGTAAAAPAPATPVLVEPTRGTLVGDAAFLGAVRAADWGAQPAPPPEQRRVVVATDTPDARVALVVGVVGGQFAGAWFTGPRGAPAGDLHLHAPGPLSERQPAALVVGGPGPATLVVVAAPGDQVDVSDRLRGGPLGTLTRVYTPVPADGGLAVVPATVTSHGPAVSVRVTSGGRPTLRGAVDWVPAAPVPPYVPPQLTALRPSGAPPPADLVRRALLDLAVPFGVEPADLQPQLLWSWQRPDGVGSVAVLVAHGPGGGLAVTTWAVHDGLSGPVAIACGTQTPPGTFPVDSIAVARVCAPPAADAGAGWLVVSVPPEAVRADVLDADEDRLATLPLVDGGAVTPLPRGATTVRTRDAAGQVVRDVPVAPAPDSPFGDFGPGPQ